MKPGDRILIGNSIMMYSLIDTSEGEYAPVDILIGRDGRVYQLVAFDDCEISDLTIGELVEKMKAEIVLFEDITQ